VRSKSMPLLARIHIALNQLSRSASGEMGSWAKKAIQGKYFRLLNCFLPCMNKVELNGMQAELSFEIN
jgi:hypothetical protein